jgi:3-hydroxyisobutyrate dehydrogenase
MKSSFIGLGAMGAPMARHLAARGLLAAVWNRTRERATELAAELGVDAPEALADVAAQSDLVFVCVAADADVRSVVAALKPGLRAGSIVVDTSTVSMQTAIDLAADLKTIGVDFLDAPLTGGVEGARNGRLSVMVGGDEAVLERARPAFEAFSLRVTRMGGVGTGQATKAVNQVMIGGIAEAVCEALAFGEALALPRAELLAVLTAGAANSWFLEKRGQSMLEGRFDSGFKLGLLHKDLGIVQAMAAALGTRLPTVDAAHADYSTLMAEGRADDEISSLVRIKRRLFS